MALSAEDFRQHFDMLSDDALLATKRADLVPLAQTVYDEELTARGLNIDDEVSGEVVIEATGPKEGDEPAPEDIVSVGEFTVIEEARIALGLLQSAEIPSGLANDKMSLGVLHLMVPASYVDAALEVLGMEISEEELAAQAEAAEFREPGFTDD